MTEIPVPTVRWPSGGKSFGTIEYLPGDQGEIEEAESLLGQMWRVSLKSEVDPSRSWTHNVFKKGAEFSEDPRKPGSKWSLNFSSFKSIQHPVTFTVAQDGSVMWTSAVW
jgi:hypothetical protein